MVAIAIDGPGGAGKSTISKAVAKKLGIVYVDTGALYRTIGYYVRGKGVSVTDARTSEGVAKYLPEITIDIKYFDGVQHVLLNGEDLGDKIREPEISMYASAVSAVGEVRAFLLETQRNIAKNNHVIMDGRDIGTVILPDAQVKIFLTASNEARAMRRFNELKEKGIDAKYEDVLSELVARDTADSSRDIAPCVPAPDSMIFDNSDYTFDQSVDKIIQIVEDICKGELS